MTAGFDRTATARDVVAGLDLTGKRAVVTGGASGIGWETARALAGAGAAVTLGVRDVAAAERLVTPGEGKISVAHLDLSDPSSIETFAARWDGPLHLLVNNAGIMALPGPEHTRDGWERQFAVNHLGHFRLAVRLHDSLRDASGARIVSVSSSSHTLSPVIFDDINFRYRPYDAYAAYAQSKTANVLFAVGVQSRWGHDGIAAHAVMPGLIKTGIQRHLDADVVAEAQAELAKVVRFKTAEQGAATSVFAATSPMLDGAPATYLEDCREAPVVMESGAGLFGVAPYALDAANAERLWDMSMAALGAAG
ncbi:MAG: SDR family NAD(P)-dependent oxidoreductase [Solirubrobacteraceae bacterium]